MDFWMVLIFLAVFFVSFYFLRRIKNLPPGPFRLPLIGSIFFLYDLRRFRPHLVLKEAAKKYGDVMSFYIGTQLVVSLNGFDVVHEALVKHADVFSGRIYDVPILRKAVGDEYGKPKGMIFRDYGQELRHVRKFTLSVLRDFGVGKTSLEDKILTEIEETASKLEKIEGQPLYMNRHLMNIALNVLYGIVFGRRYDYDDAEFRNAARMIKTSFSGEGTATTLGNFLPDSVVKIIDRKQYDQTIQQMNSMREMRQYVSKQISDHEETFDKNNIRDFIDLYLKTLEDGSVSDKEGLDNEEMFRIIMDLFVAGAETTATSLDWAILYMTEYPEVQRKCQEEIKEVFGDKVILYADRGKLPFVEATSLEVQRIASIVPLAVAHCTQADTTLSGYNIPKDTMVIPSIYGTSYDERHWENPSEFEPERFLDQNGKLLKKEAMNPFSTGPRQCLGEPLAKIELFLIFANLLQRFTFEKEDKNIRHSFESVMHQVTNLPKPYKCRAIRRK